MRLSELTPCDNCGQVPRSHFYPVTIDFALFTPQTEMTLGMARYFGGIRALPLAEVLSPGNEIVLASKEQPEIVTKLLICADCYLRPLNLAALAERKAERQAGEKEEANGS